MTWPLQTTCAHDNNMDHHRIMMYMYFGQKESEMNSHFSEMLSIHMFVEPNHCLCLTTHLTILCTCISINIFIFSFTGYQWLFCKFNTLQFVHVLTYCHFRFTVYSVWWSNFLKHVVTFTYCTFNHYRRLYIRYIYMYIHVGLHPSDRIHIQYPGGDYSSLPFHSKCELPVYQPCDTLPCFVLLYIHVHELSGVRKGPLELLPLLVVIVKQNAYKHMYM